ncbi:hypothetical protein D3C81_953040 [compost metagenome]
MQEDPCRGDHHRHVVLGFTGELVVGRIGPEALPACLAVDAGGAAFAAVVGRQGVLDVLVEPAHALIHIGRTGLGGAARIKARVEAGAVLAQAETAPGSRHELHQARRAHARGSMHAAIGLLGHDAEQQRFGQRVLLPLRPHHRAQVHVVLVAGQQRRAHVGEPTADARLDGRVVFDHFIERVPMIIQQCSRARGFGHIGNQRRDMVGVGFQRTHLLADVLSAAIGLLLEQALVGGEQATDLATLLRDAGGEHVFHVLQRRVGLRGSLGIGIGHQHQRVVVALLRGGHARLDGIHLGLVAGRKSVCGRHHDQQRGSHQQRQGTNREQGNGHQRHCRRKVKQGSRRTCPGATMPPHRYSRPLESPFIHQ